METEIKREAWDRQPDETRKAYDAFRIYLFMESRSILSASRQYHNSPNQGRPSGRISAWATRFKWTERAALYDAHIQDIQRAAEDEAAMKKAREWAKRRVEIREEGFRLGGELLTRAREILALPVVSERIVETTTSEDGKTTTTIIIREPLRISGADAVKFAQAAMDLQRLAAGMETSRTGISDVEEDLSNYTDDELRQIAAGRVPKG